MGFMLSRYDSSFNAKHPTGNTACVQQCILPHTARLTLCVRKIGEDLTITALWEGSGLKVREMDLTGSLWARITGNNTRCSFPK